MVALSHAGEMDPPCPGAVGFLSANCASSTMQKDSYYLHSPRCVKWVGCGIWSSAALFMFLLLTMKPPCAEAVGVCPPVGGGHQRWGSPQALFVCTF